MTPDQHTIQEHFLDVGDDHQLYVHEWGNAAAKTPILYLHGGPGSACRDRHKAQFDPAIHRVIFFDQRGCGRSLPYGSLEHNTTTDLVADITKIADHLGLKQFILRGGSWGSCLALTYAIQHPGRVTALVLDGIFTSTQREIDWLRSGGMRTFYPDAWDAYLTATPDTHHHDPSTYHTKHALSADPAAAKRSAYAHENLEAGVISLDDRFTPADYDTYDPTGMIIEIKYLAEHCYLPEGYILDHAHQLTMPVYLIQGRYDMVCPPITAYELHQKLPDSQLIWTISGHHSERESATVISQILRGLTR